MTGWAGFWIFLGLFSLSMAVCGAPHERSLAGAAAQYFRASADQIRRQQ